MKKNLLTSFYSSLEITEIENRIDKIFIFLYYSFQLWNFNIYSYCNLLLELQKKKKK